MPTYCLGHYWLQFATRHTVSEFLQSEESGRDFCCVIASFDSIFLSKGSAKYEAGAGKPEVEREGTCWGTEYLQRQGRLVKKYFIIVYVIP